MKGCCSGCSTKLVLFTGGVFPLLSFRFGEGVGRLGEFTPSSHASCPRVLTGEALGFLAGRVPGLALTRPAPGLRALDLALAERLLERRAPGRGG